MGAAKEERPDSVLAPEQFDAWGLGGSRAGAVVQARDAATATVPTATATVPAATATVPAATATGLDKATQLGELWLAAAVHWKGRNIRKRAFLL